MASSAESWIPKGTHEVQIGPSLNKALKARKGGPPPQVKRTGPPEKDFYSFRYNFRPPSVETTRPGSIQINRAKDATTSTIIVEHPSSQPGETHVYTGTEAAVKEVDCILIYDEETGSYKLEKLESSIILNYGHKAHAASLPASSASTPKLETDTEATRLSQDADADGDIDDELPSHFFAVPEESEEEEEDGELEPVPVLPPPPPPPPAKPAKAAPPPKQRPEPVAPRPTKPVPQRKKKAAAAPPPPPQSAPPPVHIDADEEDLEFGRPAMKRAKHTAPASPAPAPAPAPAPVAFSLPGSSSGVWVPPPAPHAQSSKAPPPSAPSPIAIADDSDEEDDWDEVAAAVPPPDAEATQEIDMNEFELTLELEMEAEMEEQEQEQDEEGSEQEDFLAAALPQAPDSAATPIRPMSMLAGFSDDEFSSSEDSDDD